MTNDFNYAEYMMMRLKEKSKLQLYLLTGCKLYLQNVTDLNQVENNDSKLTEIKR